MIKSSSILKHTFLILALLFALNIQAQKDTISNISYIQKLIKNDSLDKAKDELNTKIEFYKSQKSYDTLTHCINILGSIKLEKDDLKKTIYKAEELVGFIKKSNNPTLSKDALIGLSNLYANARDFKKNYDINQEALTYAYKINPLKIAVLSQIEYNLGTSAINLNNLKLAEKHLYTSKKILEANPEIEKEQFYLTYNSIGRIKARLLELDSSSYYYNKSLKALYTMGDTPINKYYRAAIVKQNIALNLFNSGKTEASIKEAKAAILDYQNFINITDNEAKKIRAIKFRLATIDNLGGFYSGIGDNKSAIAILNYSYKEKLKTLSEDHPNVIISTLILGHVHLVAKNFKKAGEYIDKALSKIHITPYYEDYALMLRASIYENNKDIVNAKNYYENCEALYRKQYQESYPFNFLEAIVEMSNFYAQNGFNDKAIKLATESYDHTKKSDFKNLVSKIKHTENLASVQYYSGNYQKAIDFSEEALSFNLKMENTLDSIRSEMKKPRTLYINAKSKYKLDTIKNTEFIKSLLTQIEKGIDILEQRKTIVNSPEDISFLISENNDLFDFAKLLQLDLYNQTKQESVLDDLIAIHESSIYNRIRSHLNIRNTITFANVPAKITQRETKLKANLGSALNISNNNIESFFNAKIKWNSFLDSIKQVYPKYYKMRYATIEEPLDSLKHNIPKNTTVVRYLFIDTILYAMVIDSKEKHIFKLDSKNVEDYTFQLSNHQSNIDSTSTKLNQLYLQLWKPFEKKVTTDNVIIIPDGPLFNLSFESLTPSKINSFKDLTSLSLLAKHAISYNYSLLLLDANKKTINYQKDFIAFAPEFNNKMKQDYSVAIKDSISIDETYLSLLPQPFSVDLAKEYSRLFDGDYFINENASKQIFKNEANEHKIIHIGTHAESNNISPELSRLIFAKNIEDEDNSLYTYEIYNENLNSNLAILTACETGKPTYQAGEGMISLAHAFNYAGSESILTSLWKIDEQSSTQIIELFYNNIKNGLSKDKALQQAKLNYISNNEGRIIAPNYWAGLVLIGDTNPIDLKSSSTILWFLLSILLLIIATIYIIKTRKK